MVVGDLAGAPVYYHQPGRLPWLNGRLGDQFGRQFVIELCSLHASYSAASCGASTPCSAA